MVQYRFIIGNLKKPRRRMGSWISTLGVAHTVSKRNTGNAVAVIEIAGDASSGSPHRPDWKIRKLTLHFPHSNTARRFHFSGNVTIYCREEGWWWWCPLWVRKTLFDEEDFLWKRSAQKNQSGTGSSFLCCWFITTKVGDNLGYVITRRASCVVSNCETMAFFWPIIVSFFYWKPPFFGPNIFTIYLQWLSSLNRVFARNWNMGTASTIALSNALGKGANKQNGNLRWIFPWRGGVLSST